MIFYNWFYFITDCVLFLGIQAGDQEETEQNLGHYLHVNFVILEGNLVFIDNTITKAQYPNDDNFIHKMKEKKKQKIEYVDQFRKISTLQKLPVISSSLNDIFDEEKDKDNNNKFMRLRKEPIIQYWPLQSQQDYVLANQFVQESVNNALKDQTTKYQKQDERIRSEVEEFKKMSKENCHTKNYRKQYKFYYKNASPPKKISEESVGKQAYKLAVMGGESESQQQHQLGDDVLDLKSFTMSKYDFFKINQKRLEENENNLLNKIQLEREEDADYLLTHKRFQKFKNIKAIMKINEFQMSHQNFVYNLNTEDEHNSQLDSLLLSKFIFKSTVKTSPAVEADAQYFRDIGLPSRNLKEYTNFSNRQKQKQQRDMIEEQIKEDTHLLHLLTQKQLNIDKSNVLFEDIANISMGRITSSNAYLCIRSERVTKAQFDKLIKKLDRYRKQEMQKGEKTEEIGIGTEDVDNSESEDKKKKKKDGDKSNPTWMLINQIMELRKQAASIEGKHRKGELIVHQNIFCRQLYNRMDILLKKLYGKVVKNPSKHPISNIEQHIQDEDIQEILTDEGKNGKILWFIIDCVQQIAINTPKQDNIKNLLKKKNISQPKLNFFKGNKLVKEQNIRAQHLYTYKDKSNPNQHLPERDRTPVRTGRDTSRTPSKNISKTPTKKGTDQKAFTATSKKYVIDYDQNEKSTTQKKIWK